MNKTKWDIFLSYMHSDRKRVQRLARRLIQKGWSVWWDARILPGQPFDAIIDQTLKSARCVIVFWSQASIKSDWVKDEASFARKKHKLIPVLLDAVAIPLGFGRLQTANLVDWKGNANDPEFKRLLAALEAVIGKPKAVPSCVPDWIAKYAKIPLQNLADDTVQFIKSRSKTFSRPTGKSLVLKPKTSRIFIGSRAIFFTVSIAMGIFLLILAFLGLKFYDSTKTRWQPKPIELKSVDSAMTAIDTLSSAQSMPDRMATPAPSSWTQPRDPEKASDAAPPPLILRTHPDTLSESEVKIMLQNHGFYDSEWNPRVHSTARSFRVQVNNNHSIIIDPLTGLMWQQSGSDNQMPFADAQEWIKELNRTGYAGFYNWRIPTLVEAMSLVSSKKHNGFLHLDGIFDTRQCWIWTSDVKKGVFWNWIVIYIDGRCYENIFVDDHYIRAVRTMD